jgi:hypothetical protein
MKHWLAAGLYHGGMHHNDMEDSEWHKEEARAKMMVVTRLQHPEIPSAMGETFVDTDIDIMLKCFR